MNTFPLRTALSFASLVALAAACSSTAVAQESQALSSPAEGHRGPPPEVFEACKGKSEGDKCIVKLGPNDVSGTCAKPPPGAPDDRLGCRPDGPPPGPPPEAIAACANKAVGAECTIAIANKSIAGRCVAPPPNAPKDAPNACLPNDAPMPPPAR